MTDQITQGDQVKIDADLLTDLSVYNEGVLVLSDGKGMTLEKDLVGPFTGTEIHTTLEPADTDTPGTYWYFFRMEPGPHTFPSGGAPILVIRPKVVTE